MQDKWRRDAKLTLSLGLRYDLEVIPIPRPTTRWSTDTPIDKNNFQPRVGVTYDLGGGSSVIRGGYGRFYDKTHFELIGGLYTGTPFTSSFVVNFPTTAADPDPRRALPTDPFLVNGPVINRALLEQQFPAGQLLRNTGASWDNADRGVPYTDQFTVGYERQLGRSIAVSADYVHAFKPRPADVEGPQPGLRATTAATSPLVRQGSADLARLCAAAPRRPIRASPTSPTGVTQPLNVGEIDYDALLRSFNKRFSQNYSARVSYTLASSRAATHRRRRRGERLPGARRHAPRPERRADQLRHAPQLRGQRHGARAEDRRPQRELGGARAERHAVQPDQQHRRPGSQRLARGAARGRRLLGHRR